MRVIVAAALMLAACGETPQEATYREYEAAQQRFEAADKAGDRARRCREANTMADLMLKAGNQQAYERDAMYARTFCAAD